MHQKIVREGNPILRLHANDVALSDIPSKKISTIIKKMSETLRATDDGIGIAAPQLGVPLRIFIASEEALAVDRGHTDDKDKKTPWEHYIFINPEIIKTSGKKIKSQEGCLSVPKKFGIVARHEKIRVRAYNEQGKKFERGASKLFARLLQHEIDHLNGILYIDRAEKIVDVDDAHT